MLSVDKVSLEGRHRCASGTLRHPERFEPIKRFVNFPIERVHMELTNACNFNCSFCPERLLKRPKGLMDLELAKRVIREIAEEKLATKIVFHIMGEPFMHPKLFDVIEYCKTVGLTSTLSSNGSFLTEGNNRRLVESGLAKINVSFQTPDPESYKLREATCQSFEEYRAGIMNLVEQNISAGSNMEVRILFMVTKKRALLEPYSKTFDIINDDVSLVRHLTDWTREVYSMADRLGKQNGSLNKVMDELRYASTNRWQILHVYPGISFETYIIDSWGNSLAGGKVIPAHFGYCSALQDHFGILWNGDVIFCCKDYDGKTASGNIADESIVDILNKPEVLKVVRGFSKYRVLHPYCKQCLGGQSILSSVVKAVGSMFFMDILRDRFYVEKTLY